MKSNFKKLLRLISIFTLLAGHLAAQDNSLYEIWLDKERGFPIISTLNIGGIDAERFNQPLEVVMDSGALLVYPFVGSVGGISFVSVAEFTVKPGQIFIEYIAGNENGKRLRISVDGKEYFPTVYDWQLIPISKYADSPYNACVSLFGPETTDEYYNIVYHAAFRNTLLGLRLLQADIMFFDLSMFWNVFSDGTNFLLGEGEVLPDETSWMDYAVQLNELFEGEKFRSWVLTDEGVNIKVNTENELVIEGNPYYYFWDADFEKYEKERKQLIQDTERLRAQNKVSEHNVIIDKLNKLEPEVNAVVSVTNKIRNKTGLLRGYNPLVYNAVQNVMLYSALFRCIKNEFPETWKEYINIIDTSGEIENVKTPNIWRK